MSSVHLLVAEETRPVAVPPPHAGDKSVVLQAVTKAAWLSIDCRAQAGAADLPPRWEVADGHYFCDSHDATAAFPFSPITEDVWSSEYLANRDWAQPLLLAGLGMHASALIQGEARVWPGPEPAALFTRHLRRAPPRRLAPSTLFASCVMFI
jgi:hypothetical protein